MFLQNITETAHFFQFAEYCVLLMVVLYICVTYVQCVCKCEVVFLQWFLRKIILIGMVLLP